MSVRTMTLREIRSKKPENVAILPNASPRKIEQKCNNAMRKAARALRDQHADRFGYRHPHVREQMEVAEALIEVDKTPALHILVALLSSMDRAEVEKIAQRVEAGPTSKSTKQAWALVRSRLMNAGEMCALMTAMDEVKREREL